VTNFDDPQYRIASAIEKVSERVRELEAFDNAMFQIKTTPGQPIERGEYHFCINTADATVEVFADGSWRNLIVGGGYTDENAQDAVGSILTDTGTIDFTDVIPGGVDHDSLLNYVAHAHIDHTAVTLTAGDGLSGGGPIAANRTFVLDLNELGVEVTIAAGDFISMVDITDNGSQKISFANFEGFIDHGNLTGLDTGADHSYIDQDVTSGASPVFDGTNFTGIPDGAMSTDYVEVAGDQMDGALVIDVTGTEALLVRKNADGGDMFVVDTTNSVIKSYAHNYIHQQSDGGGFSIYGYDDESGNYIHNYIDDSGTAKLASNSAVTMTAGGGNFFFSSTADIAFKLGDAAGANKIILYDSAWGTPFRVDSLGRSTFQGKQIIDVTATEALLVRKDADGGDVFTVNTTSSIVTATANVYPGTDNTYYLGKNDDDSPQAWKGVILKDQTTGTYYRLQIDNGAVNLIDLTD